MHRPVLLQEVLEYIKIEKGEKYIDATVGMGGHALAIVKKGGVVLGIDKDGKSLDVLKDKCQRLNIKRLKLAKGDFSQIAKLAEKHEFTQSGGVLFDLGVSSWQIEKSGRGISYQKDEPLDMRLDSSGGISAEDILKNSTREELYEIFSKFSEEKHSWRIADAVFRARTLKSTKDLKNAVQRVVGKRKSGIKTVARIFQGLRIAVNNELYALQKALPQALEALRPKGRILVISFHSLEDRIVKRKFKEFKGKALGRIITGKPIRPAREELRGNPRARSAKMRVFLKN